MKTICDICEEVFENVKIKANHVRWEHRDNSKYIESARSSSIKFHEKKLGSFKLFDVFCKKCNSSFLVRERTKSFPNKENYYCSRNCSNSHIHSNESKNKISKSVKKYLMDNPEKRKPISIEFRECLICNIKFEIETWRKKKTCGKECFCKLMSKNSRLNPNCGGETNFKKFKYNDIWMDSSWEVNIAKWLDENCVKWKRDRKMNFKWTDVDGKSRRYYPDFYLEKYDVYLDPKNKYLIEKDTYKINKVQSENNIRVIFGLQENVISEVESLLKIKQHVG